MPVCALGEQRDMDEAAPEDSEDRAAFDWIPLTAAIRLLSQIVFASSETARKRRMAVDLPQGRRV